MEPVLNETIFPDFITYDAAGEPVDADSAPTCEVYEDGAAAAMAYAPTVTQRGSLPGQYYAEVALTGGNAFDVGKTYSIYAVATVATVATKTKIASFVLREFSNDALASIINTLIGTPVTDVSADIAAIKAQTDLLDDPLDVNVAQWLGTAVTADTAGVPNVNTVTIENSGAGGAITSQVWDSSAASYTIPGSFGEALGNAGNPWSVPVSGNTTSGTFGEAVSLIPADPATETTLAAIQAQTDLIPADPATETTLSTLPGDVWEEATAGHVTSGTMGEAISLIQGQVNLIPADPATETTLASIKAQTDLLPAAPASEATLTAVKAQTDLIPADPATETTLAAIQAKTDLIPADPATEATLAAIKAQTDLIPADPATEATLSSLPGDVWEELAASHVTANTMGELLNGAGNPWSIAVSGNTDSGTFGEAVSLIQAQTDLIPADPATETSVAAVASDVWDEMLASHVTGATMGEAINMIDDIKGQTDVIPADPATETTLAIIQGQTDLIPASPATEGTLAVIQAQTDLIPASPATEGTLAVIQAQTDLIPADPATETTLATLPDAVWDVVSASHVTAGTTGKKLTDASAAGNPWSAAVVDNADPGTMGELMGQTIPSDLADVTAGLADTTAGLANVLAALPQGDGTVTVDHNSGGTDNLTYKTSGGAGIDNAVVQAFLKTDYDAGRRSAAYVAGETQTNVYGRWVRPMKLDPANYVFIFYKQAFSGPDRKDYTVA